MHETFNRLIEHYGTLGILIVTTIEGEFGPLIGGAMARLGKLNLMTLLLACWFGATLSTTTFFAIGRSQRDGRLVHKVTHKRGFALAIKWIDRHPRLFCFFYRFVYGLRIVGPVAISLSLVRWQTFVVINLFSSLLWAILGLSVGWYVGPGAAKMVGYASTWLTGVLITHPIGKLGPATISGTPAISSYMVDLPHRPRAPRLSPWSLV